MHDIRDRTYEHHAPSSIPSLLQYLICRNNARAGSIEYTSVEQSYLQYSNLEWSIGGHTFGTQSLSRVFEVTLSILKFEY